MQQGQLVLSIFPGIDLLGRAFEEQGCCVVRGPDVLWGGDIRTWHPPAGRFDGVIGGPPCQCFSRLAHIVRHNGHEPKFGNLIPEFERCVMEAHPRWFLMEEVPDAPTPVVSGYAAWSTLVNNRQFGEAQNRVRRFTFGLKGEKPVVLMLNIVALENPRFEYAATGKGQNVPVAIGGSGKVKVTKKRTLSAYSDGKSRSGVAFRNLCQLQGLPDDFDLPGFTVEAKCQAIGNGVPMAMGRAIAKAVVRAIERQDRQEVDHDEQGAVSHGRAQCCIEQ